MVGSTRATPLPLPEIMLRAAGVVPPMILLVAPPWMATPKAVLGTAAVPSKLVPMKLPVRMLFVAPALTITVPLLLLPEMTFPLTVLFGTPIDGNSAGVGQGGGACSVGAEVVAQHLVAPSTADDDDTVGCIPRNDVAIRRCNPANNVAAATVLNGDAK